MKKLISCILGLCLIAAASFQASAWWNVGVVGGGVPAAVTTYPDILFYHSFETSTTCSSCNADKYVGDNIPTCESAAAIDSELAAVGSNSLDASTSYDRMHFVLNNDDNCDVDSGRMGAYVYFTTIANGFGIFRAYYDANNYISLTSFGTTQLRLVYRSGGTSSAFNSSTGVISSGTWYYIEIRWNKGGAGNDYEIYVDGVSVGSDDTATGDWTKGASGQLVVGDFEGNSGDVHFDQFIVTNDQTRSLNDVKAITSFPN